MVVSGDPEAVAAFTLNPFLLLVYRVSLSVLNANFRSGESDLVILVIHLENN